MDESLRFKLLEEIGIGIRKLGDVFQKFGNIAYVEVMFYDNDDEPKLCLPLGQAIESLAGNVYHFEEFDLTDAVRCTIITI